MSSCLSSSTTQPGAVGCRAGEWIVKTGDSGRHLKERRQHDDFVKARSEYWHPKSWRLQQQQCLDPRLVHTWFVL